ncbi:hypothetical protein EVA_04538 [gut metagenome]|uniref:Uncharacterized protein n=1 Tax=gut metagenome TaxID=749906 RepID=J9H1N8_9ZZZZ
MFSLNADTVTGFVNHSGRASCRGHPNKITAVNPRPGDGDKNIAALDFTTVQTQMSTDMDDIRQPGNNVFNFFRHVFFFP